MEKGRSNAEALREAGFEIKHPLPDAYEDVIEGLTEEELALLVDLKRRLDDAEARTPPEAGPYREYFVPF